VRTGLEPIDETGLLWRVPDPTDSSVDDFDAGPDPAAEEVTTYFRLRSWTGAGDWPVARCLEFRETSDRLVALAAFGAADVGYPMRNSRGTPRSYLFIYQLGVNIDFRGVTDAQGTIPRTYAEEAVRALMALASAEGLSGLYLNVRVDNARARAFYRRLKFAEDGTYQRKADGVPMIRMRYEM
jgi:ribosomal protein S18 acetylase RimI-like enzyme